MNTTDALLVQNKILTQQLEQLTAQMTQLPQKLHVVQSLQSQNVPLWCDFCGGDHLNGHCSYQNNAFEAEVNYMGNQGRQGGFSNNYSQGWKNNQNQNFGWKRDYNSSNKQGPFQQRHQSNSPSILDRMNKVEDVLSKIVSAQENGMASIRSMETQIGQLVKQMSQLIQTIDGKIGQFSTNTTTNPKEHCNNITTEGDEKTREENGEMVKIEKEKGENRKEGEKM